MSAPHYFVFIGSTPSLSTELLRVAKRVAGLKVIAPAAPKGERGLSSKSITSCLTQLVKAMRQDGSFSEPARLSVWSYPPKESSSFEYLWGIFGQSGWVEFVPEDFSNKDGQTRQYIENEIAEVVKKLHVVSAEIYARRRNSAFVLPFANFRSNLIDTIRGRWYGSLDQEAITSSITRFNERFRQIHVKQDGHLDERRIVFKAASTGACHGLPHPTGDNDCCFVSGRFRFGAAIYPGFHYDVRAGNGGLLRSAFVECGGQERDLKPERRSYINIFPNDFILPQK